MKSVISCWVCHKEILTMSARKFMGVASVLEELKRESDEENGFLSELEEDEIVGDLTVDGTEYILPVCQKVTKLSSLLPHEQDSLLLLDSEVEPNGSELECEDGINEEIGDEQIDTVVYHGDEESDEKCFEWTHAENNCGINPVLPDFSHSVGVQQTAKAAKTLLDVFKLFFTDQLIDELVSATNLYAEQCRSARIPSPSNRWTPVTSTELCAFFGVLIAKGIVNLPHVNDFWTSHPIMQHPWFSLVFSRDRFKQIIRYFHHIVKFSLKNLI